MAAGEGGAVVVELGSTLRVGAAGAQAPAAEGPAVICSVDGVPVCGAADLRSPGLEIDSAMSPNGDIPCGTEQRWLRWALRELRRTAGVGDSLDAALLVLPPHYSEAARVAAAELALSDDGLGAARAALLPSPAAAAFACGLCSACVIDCGERAASICPVSSGWCDAAGCASLAAAGARATAAVGEAVGAERLARALCGAGASDSAVLHAGRCIARRIKEQHCRVPRRGEQADPVSVQLPDGTTATLPSAVVAAPSELFEADGGGATEAVLGAVGKVGDGCPVVVCGGASLTTGFDARLLAELAAARGPHVSAPIAPEPHERPALPWVGGSITAAALPAGLWLSAAAFREQGERAVRRLGTLGF
eukprot:TRINITY_DN47727_c0_g1_i1.p1 TRINITY_DN47727_c0_g1~~TRINITY_DN47727_c0_g1_i1.p1  ORF type:complete len:385 (+),score=102.75 TRINITY_DN47727_c0_g1_i1:64-1155(+)